MDLRLNLNRMMIRYDLKRSHNIFLDKINLVLEKIPTTSFKQKESCVVIFFSIFFFK